MQQCLFAFQPWCRLPDDNAVQMHRVLFQSHVFVLWSVFKECSSNAVLCGLMSCIVMHERPTYIVYFPYCATNRAELGELLLMHYLYKMSTCT